MSKESSVSVPIRCHYDELMPIDTAMALLDKKNPNKHTEDDVKDMAKTLSLVGWEHPIVIVNKTVHYGNKRTRAAKYAGFTHVPVVYRTYESKDLETITKIADNAAGQRSELDLSIVNELTLDLGPDIELDVLGIKDFEPVPEDKYANKSDEESDSIPDTKENELGVKTGDLWILGNHRLLCGDATKKEDVDRLMDGQKADMIFTDPPYGVSLGMNETEDQAKARNRRTDKKVVSNDNLKGDSLRKFLQSSFTNQFNSSKEGAAIYVAHADLEGYGFRGALVDSGWMLKQCLIWKKSSLVMGRQDYHWMHEPILYGWKPGAAHNWYSDRKQTTIWEFDKPIRSEEHPTMKPVELITYAIKNSSKKSDLILDSFLGSGSTLIACEKTNRRCFGMEIDAHYCSVIIKRWETFTGNKAHKET